MDIINKNAVYRQFIIKSGDTTRSYQDIARAISNDKKSEEILTEKEKEVLKSIIDKALTQVIRNIINS